MVAVIGRPAKRKLAQITRAYNKPVVIVGNIHKHKRAHSRLRILVGNVFVVGLVTYILKML